MKTYARIEDNMVRELVTTDTEIATLFHPSLRWVDVTGNDVQVGWVVVAGGGFAAPPAAQPMPMPPRLADLVAEIADLQAKLAALHPPA
jgi:hypothetical protein